MSPSSSLLVPPGAATSAASASLTVSVPDPQQSRPRSLSLRLSGSATSEPMAIPQKANHARNSNALGDDDQPISCSLPSSMPSPALPSFTTSSPHQTSVMSFFDNLFPASRRSQQPPQQPSPPSMTPSTVSSTHGSPVPPPALILPQNATTGASPSTDFDSPTYSNIPSPRPTLQDLVVAGDAMRAAGTLKPLPSNPSSRRGSLTRAAQKKDSEENAMSWVM
ncbi:uncharacterized protein MONBRDRAFT_37127, partial [Monosiga brevicollis MX1]